MLEENLNFKKKKRFKITTNSNHKKKFYDNILERNFNVSSINRVWVSDITYIPTNEGWLYLCVILDLFSRKVISWKLSPSMSDDLIIETFRNAIRTRKPSGELLFHSDRGSQYCSSKLLEIAKRHNVKQSMSRKGNCWDNAVVESFFRTLKVEWTEEMSYATRELAKLDIFYFIEVFYNRERIHSKNKYLSPYEYEVKSLA